MFLFRYDDYGAQYNAEVTTENSGLIMLNEKWKLFEFIWNERRAEFFLCHVIDSAGEYDLIMHVSGHSSSYYVIEDDVAYRMVKEKMRENGIPVIPHQNLDQYIEQMQSYLRSLPGYQPPAPPRVAELPLWERIVNWLRGK
jgi:hypothetical protein